MQGRAHTQTQNSWVFSWYVDRHIVPINIWRNIHYGQVWETQGKVLGAFESSSNWIKKPHDRKTEVEIVIELKVLIKSIISAVIKDWNL